MTTYLKQFGQYRTATNYLQVLLERNFADVHVLTNILGHKHGPPVDWLEWLATTSKEFPADLPAAVEACAVRVIITIKDPYGWQWSMLKRRKNRFATAARAYEECREYNRCYAAWFARCCAEPLAAVVRFEDLISDLPATLCDVEQRLRLEFSRWPPVDEPCRVESGERIVGDEHDRDFWRERRYLSELPQVVTDMVTAVIDWDLLAPWGYEPLTKTKQVQHGNRITAHSGV